MEYIQAADNNGAYIDLGITYDQGCTCELNLIYNGGTDIWGVFQKDLKRARLFASYKNSFAFNIGYNVTHVSWTYSDSLTAGESYILKVTAKTNNVKIENLTTGHVETISVAPEIINYTCTENMYLLSEHYKGTPLTSGIRTVKSFKYWDKDDNLLRDMIPCYRKSDNVIGMFDKVSQTFFTNAGTGTFTKGNNV